MERIERWMETQGKKDFRVWVSASASIGFCRTRGGD